MIRVVVVAPEALMCSMITVVLESHDDIMVLASATTADEALSHAETCDVILGSAQLPEQGVLRIAQAVADQELDIGVVVMGVNAADGPSLVRIEAAVAGIVPHGAGADELVNQVKRASTGTAALSPTVMRAVMERVAELSRMYARPRLDPDLATELSSREEDVLDCLAAGMTNAEIGERLCSDVESVKNHVHHILDKLDALNRDDAVRYLQAFKASHAQPNGRAHRTP